MTARALTAPTALLALLFLAPLACAEGEETAPAEPAAAGGEEMPPEPTATSEPRGKYFWVETATVASVDPSEGALTVDEPEGRFTYRVDDATLFRKGGETVPFERLAEGDRVAISAHEGVDAEDPPVADTVQVVVIDAATGEPVRRGDLEGEASGGE